MLGTVEPPPAPPEEAVALVCPDCGRTLPAEGNCPYHEG